jgi:hypothetical protein
MANGDAAAAAGMDVVPATADRRQGYDEINKTRDYLADRALRQARGRFSTAAIAGNGSSRSVGITFPPDIFTEPPVVVVSTSQARVNPAVGGVTATGATIGLANFTTGLAAAFEVTWYAVQA